MTSNVKPYVNPTINPYVYPSVKTYVNPNAFSVVKVKTKQSIAKPSQTNKLILEKIYSPRKKVELTQILQNPQANNNQRCHLVGFLYAARPICYSRQEIFQFIAKNNFWSDYDPKKTWYYINKICDSIDNKK